MAPSLFHDYGEWAGAGLVTGTVLKESTLKDAVQENSSITAVVEAEQVHGGSLAVVTSVTEGQTPVKGCDALMTNSRHIALGIRTADCLPVLFSDHKRQVIAAAHAGWRGLHADILSRTVVAFRHHFQVPAEDIHVLIGPSIRGCCYQVSESFSDKFDSFKEEQSEGIYCDLIGYAKAQMVEAGISADSIQDEALCTACGSQEWSSVRRDGADVGRMTSFIAQI